MIEFDRDVFAKMLYDICWDRRISNRDLAKECGVSPATICRIISKRKTPDADTLVRILHYTGDSIYSFIKTLPTENETK